MKGETLIHQALDRHLPAIEERIQHLLGLRTVIHSLLSHEHTSCDRGECACVGCQARRATQGAAS